MTRSGVRSPSAPPSRNFVLGQRRCRCPASRARTGRAGPPWGSPQAGGRPLIRDPSRWRRGPGGPQAAGPIGTWRGVGRGTSWGRGTAKRRLEAKRVAGRAGSAPSERTTDPTGCGSSGAGVDAARSARFSARRVRPVGRRRRPCPQRRARGLRSHRGARRAPIPALRLGRPGTGVTRRAGPGPPGPEPRRCAARGHAAGRESRPPRRRNAPRSGAATRPWSTPGNSRR